MLDFIKKILNELIHYLKIKQSCIIDYLNLWKSRDNKNKFFNDYMLLHKIQDNMKRLENLDDTTIKE